MQKIKTIILNIVAVIVLISLMVIIFYQNRDRDFLKFGRSESKQTDQEFRKADLSSTGNRNTDIVAVGENIVHITRALVSKTDNSVSYLFHYFSPLY